MGGGTRSPARATPSRVAASGIPRTGLRWRSRGVRARFDLGFVDSQYGLMCEAPERLARAIDEAVPAPASLLAPAALSSHRDHRSVLAAALVLRDRGRIVGLYADVPHATRYGWPAWVTRSGRSCWWTRRHTGTASCAPAVSPSRSFGPMCTGSITRRTPGSSQRCAPTGRRCQRLRPRSGYSSRPDILRYEIVWLLPLSVLAASSRCETRIGCRRWLAGRRSGSGRRARGSRASRCSAWGRGSRGRARRARRRSGR